MNAAITTKHESGVVREVERVVVGREGCFGIIVTEEVCTLAVEK